MIFCISLHFHHDVIHAVYRYLISIARVANSLEIIPIIISEITQVNLVLHLTSLHRHKVAIRAVFIGITTEYATNYHVSASLGSVRPITVAHRTIAVILFFLSFTVIIARHGSTLLGFFTVFHHIKRELLAAIGLVIPIFLRVSGCYFIIVFLCGFRIGIRIVPIAAVVYHTGCARQIDYAVRSQFKTRRNTCIRRCFNVIAYRHVKNNFRIRAIKLYLTAQITVFGYSTLAIALVARCRHKLSRHHERTLQAVDDADIGIAVRDSQSHQFILRKRIISCIYGP